MIPPSHQSAGKSWKQWVFAENVCHQTLILCAQMTGIREIIWWCPFLAEAMSPEMHTKLVLPPDTHSLVWWCACLKSLAVLLLCNFWLSGMLIQLTSSLNVTHFSLFSHLPQWGHVSGSLITAPSRLSATETSALEKQKLRKIQWLPPLFSVVGRGVGSSQRHFFYCSACCCSNGAESANEGGWKLAVYIFDPF